jgi:hypothetical protein
MLSPRLPLAVCLLALAALVAHADPAKVWPADIARSIAADTLVPDPMPAALEFAGPRNGTVSGQAVVASPTPIVACTATYGKLMQEGGAGVIPATAIRIRYASIHADLVPGEKAYFGRKDTGAQTSKLFDALSETCIPGETVQPVWLSVRIPKDAPAGVYTGTLAIAVDGAALTMPVRLTVFAFTLPDPADYRMWLSFNQSPDTVAIRYGEPPSPARNNGPASTHKAMPLYTPEHFALMERSMALLGELGNHVLFVPVLERTHLGNSRGLVQFRRNGENLEPDFTVFDTYYALYRKYNPTPRVMVLGVWDVWMGGKTPPATTQVTVIDAAGRFATEEVPAYPEGKAFWQGFMEKTLAHLEALKVPADTVRLGMVGDAWLTAAQIDFFTEIAPKLGWATFTHGYGGIMRRVTYIETVDCTPARKTIRGGWNITDARLNAVRDIHRDGSPPHVLRVVPDISVGYNKVGWSRGLARVGLDYWGVVLPDARNINGRYGMTRLVNRGKGDIGRVYRTYTGALTVPGPEGALATARFENMREGIQETEARIVLEEALVGKRVTGDLQARCEQALIDRLPVANFAYDAKWQEEVAELYRAAGEVQTMAGK